MRNDLKDIIGCIVFMTRSWRRYFHTDTLCSTEHVSQTRCTHLRWLCSYRCQTSHRYSLSFTTSSSSSSSWNIDCETTDTESGLSYFLGHNKYISCDVSADRIISKTIWPPRSPDLSPPDFCLCGAMNNSVYSNNPHKTEELKMAITEYIRNMDRAILNTVFENTVRRVNKCLQTDEGHFEHYL